MNPSGTPRSRLHKYIIRISPKDAREEGRAFIPEIPESVNLSDLDVDPVEADSLLPTVDAGVSYLAQTFYRELCARIVEQAGQPDTLPADGEILKSLRALGYVDEPRLDASLTAHGTLRGVSIPSIRLRLFSPE